MAAHAYPHIVFATSAETLPRAELQSLVTDLFADHDPTPVVTQGPLQVELRLGDYAFTFWYDDDAEGLGERYADYAPPLKKRRVGRCTTMIDLSGAADPQGQHGADARRLLDALASREDVYVFSEETKSFVGMDERDPFADTPTPLSEPETSSDDVTPVAPAAPSKDVNGGEPDPATEPRTDDATQPTAPAPAPVDAPTPPRSEDVRSEDVTPTPDTEPRAAEQPDGTGEPADDAQQGGFFKRLFGRGRR